MGAANHFMSQAWQHVALTQQLETKILKKFVLLLAWVCMFTGCSQAPDRPRVYDKSNYNNLFKIQAISKEQTEMIRNNTADYERLLLNINKATLITADQNDQCIRAYQTQSYFDCLSHLRSVNQESAKIEVTTARYLAQKGKKEKAKQMYQSVLKTYFGEAYRPYVKQAQIDLEDLK